MASKAWSAPVAAEPTGRPVAIAPVVVASRQASRMDFTSVSGARTPDRSTAFPASGRDGDQLADLGPEALRAQVAAEVGHVHALAGADQQRSARAHLLAVARGVLGEKHPEGALAPIGPGRQVEMAEQVEAVLHREESAGGEQVNRRPRACDV